MNAKPTSPSQAGRPDPALARRMTSLGSSAVRDLLSITARPDIVSMAGGLPDRSAMPRDWLAACLDDALAEPGALQYSTTEGDAELRAIVAGWEADWSGRPVTPEDVLITTGSQQALGLIGSALLDPGDQVVVEDPAYVGALGAFRLAEPELVAIPQDEQGMQVDVLEERLAAGLRPKLVYVTPTFHNPAGSTLPEQRRRRLVELAGEHGFWLIEDDAYRMLWFQGPPPAPIASFGERVLHMGTFSKILSPGLRVGWLVAPPALRRAVMRVKQSTDLHTSTLGQIALRNAARDGAQLEQHLEQVRALYSRRAQHMLLGLDREFGTAVQVVAPTGGMFCWARFTDGTDTGQLLPAAIAEGAAFVPGEAFSITGSQSHAARLCFASVPEEQLDLG
ncbi:MAG: PLP-dependent aminotransferase family protein, partial [Candidatus Dormibacteraceae bacterium]